MRITFTAHPAVPFEDQRRNEQYANSLGLSLGRAEAPVAVVGGGPSIADHIDALKSWDGEVWAINGAFRWCHERGIDAIFYTADQSPKVVPMVEYATKAILATNCDVGVFKALAGARIEAAKVGGDGLACGVTSATTAPSFAMKRGNVSVTFFGCESSYGETTHAYQDVPGGRIVVRCNGEDFLTCPGMYIQAETLALLIRSAPGFLSERSGGLLSAMVADPEHDIIAATRDIHEALREETEAAA